MTPFEQHKIWRPDVAELVAELERSYKSIECITYVDHPWEGWDGRSFDVWQDAETWTPAPLEILRKIRRRIERQEDGVSIRHTILQHRLWTSFGGVSRWEPDDHSGRLRHLHVTCW